MASPSETSRLPSIFIAHGAPPLLDTPRWMAELKQWGDALPRPKAVLMVSAHWEERPATVGATTPVPLIYDFYGFPEHYYRLKYPSPGAPALAKRVRELLEPGQPGQPVASEPNRGLDHGAFVPLLAMYPKADVPVLQLSLPSEDPAELLKLGQSLAPLRDEGVLIAGSGFLTHNLRAVDWNDGPPPKWAVEFDDWVEGAITRRDVDALLDYRNKAPAVRLALPTHEHFVPLLVTLGAAMEGRVSYPITGFWMGSLTRRSVQLG